MPFRTTPRRRCSRGIRGNRVIVGAYVDKRGGVCPMLAAHRNGGRTDFGTFARAWDAYTGAKRKPRRASRREVRTLEGYLEIALTRDGAAPLGNGEPEPRGALADEISEVKATRRRLAEADAHRERRGHPRTTLLAAPTPRPSSGAPRPAPSRFCRARARLRDAWSAELERADTERP